MAHRSMIFHKRIEYEYDNNAERLVRATPSGLGACEHGESRRGVRKQQVRAPIAPSFSAGLSIRGADVLRHISS